MSRLSFSLLKHGPVICNSRWNVIFVAKAPIIISRFSELNKLWKFEQFPDNLLGLPVSSVIILIMNGGVDASVPTSRDIYTENNELNHLAEPTSLYD